MDTKPDEKDLVKPKPVVKPLVLRKKEVAILLGIGASTLADWTNKKSPRFNPSFPRARRLGAATVVWLVSELESWLVGNDTQN